MNRRLSLIFLSLLMLALPRFVNGQSQNPFVPWGSTGNGGGGGGGGSTGVVIAGGAGYSDSTALVQSAIDAGCGVGKLGIVFLPGGTYIINTTGITNINGPCTIYGAGDATQIKPSTTGTWAADAPMFSPTNNTTNLRFSNLEFVNPSAITGGPIIPIKGFIVSHFMLDHVKFIGTSSSYDFCVLYDAVTHGQFDNNYCYNPVNTGIALFTINGPTSDVAFTGNNTMDTPQTGNGIYCQNSNSYACSNIRIDSVNVMQFGDTGIEVGSGGGTAQHSNITISNSTVTNSSAGKAGIICRDCNTFTISNNTVSMKGFSSAGPVYSPGIFAWAQDASISDGLITGNNIVQPAGGSSHGPCISVYSQSVSNEAHRISVIGNNCTPGTGTDTAGIMLQGYDDNATWASNTVKGIFPNDAMKLDCSIANCTGLNVQGNTLDGGFWALEVSNVIHSILTQNFLKNAGHGGFTGGGTLTGTVFSPNYFYNNDSSLNVNAPIPTVTSCQTSPTQPVNPSTNQYGKATVGTGGTTCNVVFNPSLDSTPLAPVLTDLTTGSVLRASSISTSGFTVNGLTAGDAFSWYLPGY